MIRVLVVDDDFMVARVHRGFTERVDGFTVVGVAHTGTEALRAAEELRPDLVLLDVYLPDMTGLEVLRRLRERSLSTDVLVVTAARDVDTVRDAMRGGVVHYLIKPFTFDALSRRLEQYATARRGLADAAQVDQSAVDSLFTLMRSHDGTLPKGLARDTADLVAAALKAAADTMSASECAAAAGLSRVAARRYLEYFVSAGRATVRPRYGTTGRPERLYRWKP
ncbi:response regulator of citrate/malate metabolism [Stackebrandtia albiflava]|uniref:Transcriptional regulatory protein n=1 Tax=Stackebrandtia albiflava TaxID=406432 RepID=A0A562V447_9ACTN|nr:response regulator [Stackebrandtia albiflava]TWJ12650.1 response regulator of citrate/malate metabolism [Stackebrandtia albiflava]